MKTTINDIAYVLGANDAAILYPQQPIEYLLTDSRSLINPESSIFFAIPTSGNDGHKYILDLYEKGVRNFVVNYIPYDLKEKEDINFFIVPDTISALQKIASRKDGYEGRILAITGSRGKTTLKEWIYQLMEPLMDISRSPRSYNSQIGVPLSMWNINSNSSLAIVEAGISKTGEMEALKRCINPDCVIFTNIGDAHSQGFTSIEAKAHEKSILAEAEKCSAIIYSLDSKVVTGAVERFKGKRELISWSYSDPSATLFLSHSKLYDGNVRIEYRYKDIESCFVTRLITDVDLENAANALAFMLYWGVDTDMIAERFRHLHKIGTRLNVSEGVNHCSVILDSYTSDLSSLLPALDFMRRRKMPHQTQTLILSDLHHESMEQSQLYACVLQLIKQSEINRFIGVGSTLSKYKDLFSPNSMFFESSKDALGQLTLSDFNDEIILIKGSPEQDLTPIAEMLETRMHETVLEVNLDSIVKNFNYFRSKLPSECGIVCMVKASGYGAGSYEIAKTLQDCGAAYLAVAVLDEGIELRRQGITMPIMVMNPKVMNYRSMFAHHLEPEIYSFEMLEDMIVEARKNDIKSYPIHIKLDTGMHRTGFIGEELPKLMEILSVSEEVSIRSAFSHLATADCPDMNDFTELQLTRFAEYTDYMLAHSGHKFLRHVLNSAGILRFPEYHYDMARLGIGLYGANTLPPEIEKPLAIVSTLRTVIIALREYAPGETVGYGRYGKIERQSMIATLPIGYADGMNRHFGRGNIKVWVNGKEAPTIGNICMDACMIDVTGIECKVGDSVEIFGANAPLQRLADTLDTIPYEILTSISPRVKRVYYRE